MCTVLSGKRLLLKLTECPSYALPHGVSIDEFGIMIDGRLYVNPDGRYEVTDNVRQRSAEEVDTIDSDWSVSLA